MFSVSCSTPTISLIFVLGLLVPRCYFFFRIFGGSSPTVTTGFLLCLLLLLSQLRGIWQLRGCFFPLPVLLLSSSVMSLGCFVDSFIGVFHWCPILLGPCNLCCATRTVDGLAWVRTFLFFLCSCIMHVSVSAVIAIVIVPICRRMGVMGWLGDISHWVSGVSCYTPCIHGILRHLLLVRGNSSILPINTSSVMLPIP